MKKYTGRAEVRAKAWTCSRARGGAGASAWAGVGAGAGVGVKMIRLVGLLLGVIMLLQCFPANHAQAAPTQGITINISDADMRDVLSALAVKMDVKMIYTEGAKKVTINAEGLTAQEALEVLLQNNGLSYIRSGGMIIVGSPEKLQQSYFHKMMLTKFNLKFVTAEEMSDLVSDLGIPLVGVTLDSNKRDIWVQGTPQALAKMSELVAAVDRVECSEISLEFREVVAGIISPDRLAGLLREAGVSLSNYITVGNRLLVFDKELFSRWDEVVNLAMELDDFGSLGYSVFSYRLKYTCAQDAADRLAVVGMEGISTITYNLPEFGQEIMVVCPPNMQSQVMSVLMSIDAPKDKMRAPVVAESGSGARGSLRAKRALLSELTGIPVTKMFVSENISGDSDDPRYVLWAEETPDNIKRLQDLVERF